MLKSVKTVRVAALLVIGIVLTAGSALAILGLGKYEKVKVVNGAVTLPVAAVSDGKAHFYTIPLEGKEVAFFVIKASDGAIKTAFDACDVCYRAKKGYEQQGGDMVCKNCNKKFAANRIGPHEVGGCNPSHLPHTEAGGNIMIRIEDLKPGARFF